MAEARQRSQWAHTSTLLALLVNLNRDPKKSKPARPEDFNPFIERKPPPVIRGADLKILRDIFVKG